MLSRRTLAAALVVLATTPLASADHTYSEWGCAPHITDASPAAPHLNDYSRDWNGELGKGTYYGAVPAGDIHREGTDILKAWLGRDEQDRLVANVQLAGVLVDEPNVVVRMIWAYDGGDERTVTKWVGARLKGYAVEYNYGYIVEDGAVTGGRQYVTLGEATGTVTPGSPALVSIVVPSDGQARDWGSPAPGATLTNLSAETSVIAGSPEPLPSPSPVRHGVTWLADTTNDGRRCDAYVG